MSDLCEQIIHFPPPPPPPPLPYVSDSFSTTLSIETPETESTEEKAICDITRIFKHFAPESENLPSTFRYSHLKPLIQDGPTCGLVALSILSNSTPCKFSVNQLYDLAYRRGFTKKGEMFSASNMAALAKEALSSEFEIVHHIGGILNNKQEVINNLLCGSMYLIPYDADKNHSPANLRGLKAHWAILCGVIVTVGDCYLLALQSKSRRIALWDFNSLHESNLNLHEIAIDKKESDDYVTYDIKTTLAGNYILFKKI